MATISEKVVPVDIEDEMKGSYIDYSMSVIVARALPDVRDGLKPVHRRVLYGMSELGLASNRPYKKSARVVGEVLGKYHPHGDTAVYDTMVRMAQDFSMRYLLADGQGNFGSVDGDSPAAMRYTEVRLTRLAEEMLRDIEKNTVAFVPNFDESLKEPTVLPSLVPNLLINGTTGIAVGMATNIPPHNLNEVIDGLVALIDNPSLSDQNLLRYVKAPDFPTGGIIYGYEGVKEAYKTGRGRIIVRAKANIETTKGDRENIVVTQLPYMVNKASLIERIAEIVREKKIEDIADIRDESDRDGMRILIELKRDATPEVVLNNLYIHTQMQTTFGVNMLALVDGRPMTLTLKQMMDKFIEHRNDVVVRRSKFDLEEAEKRAHILEGFIIALDNIDAVIALIKKSKDVETAKTGLMKKFKLSEIQAKAILDMRLQRLTGLERKKIEVEYKETIKLIEKLRAILKSKKLQMQIIKEELSDLKKKYGDERRTEIVREVEEFSVEDMIAEEDVVITISHNGFVKRSPVSSYRRQGRGGRGVTGAVTREDDFIEHMFVGSTHHYMLIFTDNGRCYWLKVFEIPEAARMARGRSIVNLIEKKPEEAITAFLTVQEFDDKHYVLMVSRSGLIKKTPLSEYSNPRRTGIAAIGLKAGDKLIDVKLTDGNQDVFIGTRDGLAIHFHESQVRPMGRTALGVRGMALNKGDRVIGMVVLRHRGTTILVATDNGYGKRSPLEEYRPTGRAGKGVITVSTNEKIGKMIAIKETMENDDIVIVTTKGMIIRQHVKDVNVLGRNTQGVRLIRLEEGDTIADVAVVPAEEEEEAFIEKRDEERSSHGKGVSKKITEAEDTRKDGQRASKSKNSGKKKRK
jgi:DNA gyrase subunit A